MFHFGPNPRKQSNSQKNPQKKSENTIFETVTQDVSTYDVTIRSQQFQYNRNEEQDAKHAANTKVIGTSCKNNQKKKMNVHR